MFSQIYFWTFIFASLFSFILRRVYVRFNGSSAAVKEITGLIGNVTYYANIIFLILGFWFMPKWWYPIALYLFSFLTTIIPIPDRILAIIGLVAAPILTILSYYFLFFHG